MNGLRGAVIGRNIFLKIPKRFAVIAAGVVAAVLVCAAAGYGVWRVVTRPPAQTESQRVIAEVGKLYSLPKGETPTVARVKDVGKLTGQDFYKNAQNGDYLLVYSKGKLALLYREKQNLLVRVGNVNLQK